MLPPRMGRGAPLCALGPTCMAPPGPITNSGAGWSSPTPGCGIGNPCATWSAVTWAALRAASKDGAATAKSGTAAAPSATQPSAPFVPTATT